MAAIEGCHDVAQFRNNLQSCEWNSHALGNMVNSELSLDPDARLLRVVDCPCCIPKSLLLCGDYLLRFPGLLSIHGQFFGLYASPTDSRIPGGICWCRSCIWAAGGRPH